MVLSVTVKVIFQSLVHRCPELITYYNYQRAQLIWSRWERPSEDYDREKKIREVRVEQTWKMM